MSEELAEVDFQRFWRRLQQLGLNAYESRSYLVLLDIPNSKPWNGGAGARAAAEIYEVLDSLVEKGFAQVVQGKDQAVLAVEPSLAIPGYWAVSGRCWNRSSPTTAAPDPRSSTT